MPRRIVPASGDGIVCVVGSGMTDDQLLMSGVELDAQRGICGSLHNNEQFESLLAQLGNCRNSQNLAALREELDEYREFWIKLVMRKVQRSTGRDRNATLLALTENVTTFQNTLANLPDFAKSLFFNNDYDDGSPFGIFAILPFNLNAFALRLDALIEEGMGPLALSLWRKHQLNSTAAAALEVAKRLQSLDWDLQQAVHNSLNWTQNHRAESIEDVIDVLSKLRTACEKVRKIGQKPGPRRSDEFAQLIFWLAKLFQSCGNEITHTPYRPAGVYDGEPHSAAGKFILAFFACFGTPARPQAISTVLARIVKKGRFND
jgi:hypothetical protein